MTDLSFYLASIAGLLSFLSPCVLPLIPSYLSILGGVGISAPNNQVSVMFKPRLLWAAAGFVLGFSVVFIILGILISATMYFIGGAIRYITLAGGVIVIILGLNIIFDFLSFLNYEKRPFFKRPVLQRRFTGLPHFGGMLAAFIAGAAFATGWTPCIGPILAGILFMAGQSGGTGIAVFYLTLYSAGLAIPFILVALFFNSFLKHGSRLRSYMPIIQRISGVILIVIGITILSGRFSDFNMVAQRMILGYIDWAENRALPFRLFADWLAWLQDF